MAKKEDVVRDVQTRMANRPNIRNMGIVAHIDHGKCVSGATKVYLANGSFPTAQELFERAARQGKLVKETKKELIYNVDGLGLKAASFDTQGKQSCAKNITHAWKLKNGGKLVRLLFSNGLKVETTPEHRFLCMDGEGRILERQAVDIDKNEFVLAPRIVNVAPESLEALKTRLLNCLAKDCGFFVWVEERAAQEIKRKALEFGLQKLGKIVNTRLGDKTFYHCVYNGRYRLADYLGLCQTLGYTQTYDSIDRINFRESIRKAGKSSVGVKLPKTEADFSEVAYLLGLIWGDGGSRGKEIRITNEDKPIIRAIEQIMEKIFGVQAKTRKYAGKATRIDLGGGLTFYKILTGFFGLPKKRKAESIQVPEPIKSAPNGVVKAFLQGYFDTDGTVEGSRRAASLSSKSKGMLLDTGLLLLRFGCLSTFNEKKSNLYISGANMKVFAEKIGFRLNRKNQKLLGFVAISDSPNRNTDLTPIAQDFLRGLRQRMGLQLKALPKSFEAIEFRKQPVYQTNLNVFFEKVYSFIGNPEIKDAEAWEEIQGLEKTFFDCFTPMVTKKEVVEGEEFVYDFSVEETHNFIGNGFIIHNTTLSDNLVASVGLISPDLAGKQQFMDYEDQEQERGITINAANVSLVHSHKGQNHLINLIDTPGHIDFTGEVIRAMRAVDGVILVVDAVEGVMPQTETVCRQSLKEYVKPVLFINKVDRLVNELKIDEKQMQEKFVKIIGQVNNLIAKNAPPGKENDWQVKVQNGSVCFGSAYNHWAISVPHMQRTGITFKDVYNYCAKENQKELAQKSQLHEAILEMVILHLPNPLEAQKYRIPRIWGKEELDSEIGKAMLACDEKGPFSMMCTDVSVDPHAGDIATGRVYSGSIRKGTRLKLIGAQKEVIIQKVGVFMGADYVEVSEIPAGNIAALVGIKEIYAGETLSEVAMKEFESFMSTAEPVITIAIEAKQTKNLPKLIEVIRQLCKEDPNLRATLNQETGEHLLSGMGELHLDINKYRIEKTHGVEITTSDPIVVYHETITKESPVIEAKSPNKHNKLKIWAEPIPPELFEKLVESRINAKIRLKDTVIVQKLIDMGFDRDEAKKTWCIHGHNMLVDATRGIVALHEAKELVIQGFQDAMNEGPLAKEKVQGVKIILDDATLHEDSIHRGPAQMLPCVTRGCYAAMLSGNAIMLEPKQKLNITVPETYMGAVSRELGSRRTQITDMRTEGDTTIIIGIAPVKELIGFSSSIRGATQGRAVWQAEYAGYDPLPKELQIKTIREVRTRKGMEPEPKPASFFMD
ncbi:MAG: elongation factor EF-2 [Candidatus Diapherotrites archaeon]|uniref:Elongation factor 2 n=1 Tax=Candidatus Iainarchaeum sp. TaxID=3101447 RepID=A0A8T4L7A3_9ARCH|nr:elongation factor EF-2 [Candidatus Diapherotrites archaeon]